MEKSKKGEQPSNTGEFNFSEQNLKFKEIISKNMYSGGNNDSFEIFQSIKNKDIYLAFPNKNDYTLDIITIKNNKLFISLKSHNNYIILVKYFGNNTKEYLFSSDKYNDIIIWDVLNKFSFVDKIKARTNKGLISGILIFINTKIILNEINKVNDYIIISYNDKNYTNIYSLNNPKILKSFKKTNEYATYCLLEWNYRKNNKNYIIELSNANIFIYNINNCNLEFILTLGSCDYSKTNSGFIYRKNNEDFLIVSSSSGIISILNLETKKIISHIYLYEDYDHFYSYLNRINISYILQWSEKYLIVCEYYNKGFKIINMDNLDKLKIITSVNKEHTGGVLFAKKFYHPIYGESLLTSGKDNCIILWSV